VSSPGSWEARIDRERPKPAPPRPRRKTRSTLGVGAAPAKGTKLPRTRFQQRPGNSPWSLIVSRRSWPDLRSDIAPRREASCRGQATHNQLAASSTRALTAAATKRRARRDRRAVYSQPHFGRLIMSNAYLPAAKIHLRRGLLTAVVGGVLLVGCGSDDGGGETGGAGGSTATGSGGGGGEDGGAGAGGGAGSDAGPGIDAGPTRCDDLVARCMPVDQDGAPSVHNCVTLGMQGDLAACENGYADCRTKCGGALCRRIGSLCHDKEQTCHELGHANMPLPCYDRALECLEACK
jgi:hypothetical protein